MATLDMLIFLGVMTAGPVFSLVALDLLLARLGREATVDTKEAEEWHIQ